MKQIYYAIQSILHGRGSNVTKVISLSLGLTIGILLFSQIAFEPQIRDFPHEVLQTEEKCAFD